MITLTALVKKQYIEFVYKHELIQSKALTTIGRNVHVITDEPDMVHSFMPQVTTIPYPKLLWSYVDKIMYTFTYAKNHNQGVIWVDSDKGIVKRNYLRYQGYGDQIVINEYWEEYSSKVQLMQDPYWEEFRTFLGKQNMFIQDIPHVTEHCFYVPPNVVTDEVIQDIEIAGSVLQYLSVKNDYPYRDDNKGGIKIGNGEGLILGYLIKKYNLPYTYIKL